MTTLTTRYRGALLEMRMFPRESLVLRIHQYCGEQYCETRSTFSTSLMPVTKSKGLDEFRLYPDVAACMTMLTAAAMSVIDEHIETHDYPIG